MKEVDRIRLAGGPGNLDLSPDGKTLAVSLPGRRVLAFLDPDLLTAEPNEIPFTAEHWPIVIRYAANGKLMVVGTVAEGFWGRIIEVDPATGTQVPRTDSRGVHMASAIRTPDYRWLAVRLSEECATMYDTENDRFSACRPTEYDGNLSISSDGSRVAFGFGVFSGDFSPLGTMPFEPGLTYTTGLSPDGSKLYVSLLHRLMTRRVSDGEPLELLRVPGAYQGLMAFSDHGRTLYVVGRDPVEWSETTQVQEISLD